MDMIFPGMDPYLEVPELWPGFHNSWIVYIRDYLRPLLRPRYIAAIEERVFVQGPQQREFIRCFAQARASSARTRRNSRSRRR